MTTEGTPGAPPGSDAQIDEIFDAALRDEPSEGPPDTSPAPADEAAQPTSESEDRPRDDKGRFVSQAKDEAAPEDEDGGSPHDEDAPTEELEEPTPPPDGDETDEASDEAQDADPYATLPKFSYRSDGQEYAIEGSVVGPNGVFIPKAELPRVQSELAAGRHHLGSFRKVLSEKEQAIKAAQDRASAEKERAQAILDHFDNLVETGRIEDWLADVERNWPILKAQSEARAKDIELKQYRERIEREDREKQEAQLEPLMERQTADAVIKLGQQAGLGKEQLKALFTRLRTPEFKDLLFPRATEDDPARNIQAGQRLTIRGDVVAREVQFLKQFAPPPTPKQKPSTPPAKAGKRPPPSVSAKRSQASPTKARKPVAPKFKTAAEVDEWFDNEGYMDIDIKD